MRKFRNILQWVIMLAAWGQLTSCNTAMQSEQPNIVWITSEDNSIHFMDLFDENGAATPNISELAARGVRFTRAYSNAPVCSVARSTLISSCYAPRIGAQFHRKYERIPMPEGIRMFPTYLREAGYYTTNNAKEDYNIIKPDDVWDESSNKASWRKRTDGQPFFHVQNIGITHESGLHFNEEDYANLKTTANPDSVFVAPVHPPTDLFRYTYARYHDKIVQMDQQLGAILDMLKEDRLMDKTFIFYFGDHGGVLPGSKGYLYETGLHVPLVVYIPEKYQQLAGIQQGASVDGMVSFIDFGATVLNLAGVELPAAIDGKPFLGKGTHEKELNDRNFTFSYADRFDEKYDLVRSIRVGPYKYIRNYQPYNVDGLQNNYRYKMLAYQEWRSLFTEGKLSPEQAAFFLPKALEALYNIEEDPYELKNLAHNTEYKDVLNDLRKKMREHLYEMPDLSFFPEHVLTKEAFNDPVTFGATRKDDIKRLIGIADLALLPFRDAELSLKQALASVNPWERYWGLMSCISFGPEASDLSGRIATIAQEDEETLNKVKAAEYLALFELTDPKPVTMEALEKSVNDIEILEILNIVALLKDFGSPLAFEVRKEDIKYAYTWSEIDSRIEYLEPESE